MDDDVPGLTEKILLLKDELKIYSTLAAEAVKTIVDNDISNYPIIVAHKHQIEIGIPIITEIENDQRWSLNASTLEEFYTKNLVVDNKLEEFKNIYKSHINEICFFVLSEIGAQFIFIPIR